MTDHITPLRPQGITDSIKKLHAIADELNQQFIERERVIDNSILALITGQTVLLIGPPGTAKSALTHELCNRIEESSYFSWLLNRTSDPSEILGPFSIKEMEQDRFVRVTHNKLPEAEIAFLDEIFKCNEPTLNILLPMINEKLFYNDGVAKNVPLVTLFAASNELPDDDALEALYDRMIFRVYVDYIGDVQNKLAMFKAFLNDNQLEQPKTTITLNELRMLRHELGSIDVSEEVLTEFIMLINSLMQRGMVISDRRQNECLKVLRAHALMDGRHAVETTDFSILKDVLWNSPEEIPELEEVLRDKAISSSKKAFIQIRSQYNDLVQSTKNMNDMRLLIEVKGSIEMILGRINRMLKDPDMMDPELQEKLSVLRHTVQDHFNALDAQLDDEDDIMMGM